MGFGYNPRLLRCLDDGLLDMERLDILEYFGVMKNIGQSFPVFEFSIWDASGYNIVGRTSPKKITRLGENPKAEDILEILIAEQDRPKRGEISANCDARSKYLQRAIEVSGLEAKGRTVRYFDSREVWRNKKCFVESLDIALDYVKKLEKDEPDLVRRILPNNTNVASSLYLPLEIAEAVYLERAFMVLGKYGPETEKYFDSAILGLQEERGVPFTSIRPGMGPRRPGYLDDKDVIWTVSGNNFVCELLERDPAYAAFVERYTLPFRKAGEPVLDCIQRLQLSLGEVPK